MTESRGEPDEATLIDQAAGLLRAGKLVAFPTETVYGLGADATQGEAVARIFEAKGRPRFDPLIVHLAEYSWLEDVASDVPEAARLLAQRFWPGPLTLVLPKRPSIPDIVTAGLPSVALRVPGHAMALRLLVETGRPIAAPSANRFGRVSPTTAEHVRNELGDKVPLILDGGACKMGVESTVISFLESRPILLRPGGLTLEDIEEVVGAVALGTTPGAESAPTSPGMLSRHYAPGTPLQLVADEEEARKRAAGRRVGFLTIAPAAAPEAFAAVEVLSETGNLAEAAAGLFAAMRRLDSLGLERVHAVLAPERGLGRAINDRLKRAAEPAADGGEGQGTEPT